MCCRTQYSHVFNQPHNYGSHSIEYHTVQSFEQSSGEDHFRISTKNFFDDEIVNKVIKFVGQARCINTIYFVCVGIDSMLSFVALVVVYYLFGSCFNNKPPVPRLRRRPNKWIILALAENYTKIVVILNAMHVTTFAVQTSTTTTTKTIEKKSYHSWIECKMC